jgi:hypothetical protein
MCGKVVTRQSTPGGYKNSVFGVTETLVISWCLFWLLAEFASQNSKVI